jgi:lipopolysaccharide transport system ATP-binding protein
MSDAIIKVSNLGKCYRLRHNAERQRYVALRDVIAEKAKSLFRSRPPSSGLSSALRPPTSGGTGPTSVLRSPSSEDFWALRDVSFEVRRGEVVGIIGRNGAGKSTLLKILSRITEPTTGRVEIDGRIASLLEVGTGFHPELTGRENIFLNGAILGMSRAEIRKKFDEIVAFAEVEKFLDTPVKRYSSGMYVRLAFAVAAHLEPEILIVDEVLAVGDAEFQKKCLGKMQDVSKGGRTVLFVSHNMNAVQKLCQRAIVLQAGKIKQIGNVEESITHYMHSTEMTNRVVFSTNNDHPCIILVDVNAVQLQKGNLIVEVGFKSPFPLNPPVAGVVITSSLGTPVFGTNPRFHKDGFGQPKLSEGVLRMVVEKLPIFSGIYHLSVWLGDWQGDYDEKKDVLAFEFKTGLKPTNTPSPEAIGFVDLPVRWSATGSV